MFNHRNGDKRNASNAYSIAYFVFFPSESSCTCHFVQREHRLNPVSSNSEAYYFALTIFLLIKEK